MTALRLSLALLFGSASVAFAQFAPPSITAPPSVTTPPPPTYGAQPYNPAAPTGLEHPNDMGFGEYHNPTRLKGNRSKTDQQRRYRGY